MFQCKILADSLSPQGDRLTTMKITFPRFILAEFNTHRMFSRNSASSRAIPFHKMVDMVQENPFVPIAWQKDHPGMQGTEYLEGMDVEHSKIFWIEARNKAIEWAIGLHNNQVTKQLCNRLLEPFMWHTVIVTASEWENFFKLRCPQYIQISLESDESVVFRSKKDVIKYYNKTEEDFTEQFWQSINQSQAEIHIQAIAELMWDAYNESKPQQLQAGEWHIPFGDNIPIGKPLSEKIDIPEEQTSIQLVELDFSSKVPFQVQIATARCARISYETLGDNPKINYEADLKLHDMLLASGHMSPFEHCAKAMSDEEYLKFVNGELDYEEIIQDSLFEDTIFYSGKDKSAEQVGWCRNFKGFIQYRHIVES